MLKEFVTGEISRVSFDTASRHLEVTWRNGKMLAFRPVPEEVVRRLCNAPNPATYLEDRIAEEYPKVQPSKTSTNDSARQKLEDLFGGSAET